MIKIVIAVFLGLLLSIAAYAMINNIVNKKWKIAICYFMSMLLIGYVFRNIGL